MSRISWRSNPESKDTTVSMDKKILLFKKAIKLRLRKLRMLMIIDLIVEVVEAMQEDQEVDITEIVLNILMKDHRKSITNQDLRENLTGRPIVKIIMTKKRLPLQIKRQIQSRLATSMRMRSIKV